MDLNLSAQQYFKLKDFKANIVEHYEAMRKIICDLMLFRHECMKDRVELSRYKRTISECWDSSITENIWTLY